MLFFTVWSPITSAWPISAACGAVLLSLSAKSTKVLKLETSLAYLSSCVVTSTLGRCPCQDGAPWLLGGSAQAPCVVSAAARCWLKLEQHHEPSLLALPGALPGTPALRARLGGLGSKVGTSWATQNRWDGLTLGGNGSWSTSQLKLSVSQSVEKGKWVKGLIRGGRRSKSRICFCLLLAHFMCTVWFILSHPALQGKRIKLFGLFCSFSWEVLTGSTPNSDIN